MRGEAGQPGEAGPGARTFTASLPQAEAVVAIYTLPNGITVFGHCSALGVQLELGTTSKAFDLQAQGTSTNGKEVGIVSFDDNTDLFFVAGNPSTM